MAPRFGVLVLLLVGTHPPVRRVIDCRRCEVLTRPKVRCRWTPSGTHRTSENTQYSISAAASTV